jgi:murein L,D-transpeptidase YafK
MLVTAESRVPASLIRIPDSVGTLFIAETSTSKFHRFDNDRGTLAHRGSHPMSIGQMGTGKERSGDRRTPLGAYFVTEQLDTSRLHEKYGITAFPVDYPNALDLREKRDGDGIWIHGVDPRGGQRPARDTDGCLALPNEDLATLIPLVKFNVTPVLITRKMEWTEAEELREIGNALADRVAEWANSQSSGDLYAFLSLYADDFERWDMNKEEWSAVRLQRSLEQPRPLIEVSDLLLLAYPEEDGVFLSRFRQLRIEGEGRIVSMKRIYWRRNDSGELQIIAENEG